MRKTGIAVGAVVLAAACSTDSARTADTSAVAAADTAMAPAPAVATPAPAPASEITSGMMDPNAVTVDQLSGIQGVTPEIASAIVAGRPYANMPTLDKVLAKMKLTEAQRDSIYSRVWTPMDLNTATDAEILLIPGIGKRMLHEFKEYRPYTSMDQFRREIGKYVDKNEVARMERFIAIK